MVGRCSSVSIATDYGWAVQGSNLGAGEKFSAPVQTGPGAHPASCTMDTGSFPEVKSVTLTPHPLLMPLVMKEYSYTSTPPMGRTACTDLDILLTVHLSIIYFSLFPTWYTVFPSTYNICYPLSCTFFRSHRPIIRRSKLYMQPVVFSPSADVFVVRPMSFSTAARQRHLQRGRIP